MTKNIHDVAYELQNAIAENTDFQALKASYAEVQGDAASKQLFEQFRTMQLELQQKMMQGQEITEEDNQKAQEVVALIQQDPKIVKLMEAEQRLNVVIGDINKIIMKPLEELYTAYQA
ncbi:YlbF/YmcA family competence regulator [Bacillus sp. Xin]|uniref:YlbF/YmcA family competence regulator n=1 Tax=unclassified Bacillus (in: firmicutes) TaxID=185979 RepID=UPI0015722185|nr:MULTISPECIES: YlbF/YmcA family competence regulator [unclassified Bacillus (in: firmicutes)]MBC6975356.1 YlbF/YmcA family competence regulator [Bacillus sp. Xin]MCI0765961.1 YlbF/YmcA family competence regulator [Bacillus sp. TL12]NSW37599.1 YlbF/YmcA family competence regulator [Bacillus sp. Xin1]